MDKHDAAALAHNPTARVLATRRGLDPDTPLNGRLTAALILARQTVALLEEIVGTPTAAPTPRRRHSRPAPERSSRTWRGQDVQLTDDEHAVLVALAAGADEHDTFRDGQEALARACRMGTARLRTALAGLTSDAPGTVLVRSLPAPRRGTHYALASAPTPTPETNPA